MKSFSITVATIIMALGFAGCATQQATPATGSDQNESGYGKDGRDVVIYDSDQNLKKAIVILIKKVDALEGRAAAENATADNNLTAYLAQLRNELDVGLDNLRTQESGTEAFVKSLASRIEALEKKMTGSGERNATLATPADDTRVNKLEEQVRELQSRLSAPAMKSDSCQIITYAMRSSGTYQAKRSVNIRSCPSMQSTVIGEIKQGERVEFVGCERYGWCKLNGRDGYVSGIFFKPLSGAAHINSQLSGSDDEVIDKYLKEHR